jgi:serralysin
MADTQFDAQYELLNKALTLSGDYNPKARVFADKVFDTLGYKVNRIFDNQVFDQPPGETPFLAIGLASKDGSKPPVLILPGGFGGNPGSPGLSEFTANKQAIQDWLINVTKDQQLNPQGLKPDVTGRSRGGALTQLTASEFPTLINSAVSFVSPGIDQKDADKFIENGGTPDQVRHYIIDGDYRTVLGETFIPGKVVVSNYDTPIDGTVDYPLRKHLSGILADFNSIFPDPNDPVIAQARTLGDIFPGQTGAPALSQANIPVDQTLSEISVDELNQPDFTWKGQDWQTVLAKVRENNPNLAFAFQRQGLEELRDTGGIPLNLVAEALQGNNPVPPDKVNKPTANSDILFGTEDNDQISGLAGNDYIRGDAGDDQLFGNEGSDILVGNAGDDLLNGGAGNDLLKGSAGNDIFMFGDCTPFSSAALGVDRINDFVVDEDSISLSKATFGNLSDDFSSVFGNVTDDVAAETSAASIVYNTSNGKLFYNTNGLETGFGDGGQFAKVFGKPTLSAEDFTIK